MKCNLKPENLTKSQEGIIDLAGKKIFKNFYCILSPIMMCRFQQEGNGPIDLRRQGPWEIGMWCCMISINPTLNYLRVYLTSYLKSATLITLVFMCILPQMASEAMAASKWPQWSLELRFEISNHDYPGIQVLIASNGLRGHGDLLMTSGHLTSDLKSATLITLVFMCILPPTASEAMICLLYTSPSPRDA